MTTSKVAWIQTKYLLPAGILTAAAIARFLFLGDHSLWLDELFSIRYAHLDLGTLISQVAAADNHPPLYYVLLHFWIQPFGDSEFAVRSLSAAFGAFSALVVYGLGVALYDQRVGTFAALIFALSKFSIYASQEARMYTLLPLLAAVSVYCFWKVIHKPGPANAIGYVVATALLLYTHSYGVFIVFGQNAFLLILLLLNAHRDLKLTPMRWAGLQAGVFVLFLPWISVLAARMIHLQSEGFWVNQPTMMTVAGTFSEFSSSGPLLRILLMLLVAMSLAPLSTLLMRSRDAASAQNALQLADSRATLLLFSCLLTPVALPFVISQISTPIYVNRAVGVGFFAFCLLAGRGLSAIKWRPASLALLLVVMTLSVYRLTTKGYVHGDQPQYRELANYVTAKAPPATLIVICDDGQMFWPFRHYYRASVGDERLLELNDEKIADGLSQTIRSRQSVWLITFTQRPEALEVCVKLPELLGENYQDTQMLSVRLPGFSVRAYSNPVAAADRSNHVLR